MSDLANMYFDEQSDCILPELYNKYEPLEPYVYPHGPPSWPFMTSFTVCHTEPICQSSHPEMTSNSTLDEREKDECTTGIRTINIRKQHKMDRIKCHQNAKQLILYGRWSSEEKEKFLEGYRLLGNKWTTIANEFVKTRTGVQVTARGYMLKLSNK